MLIIASSVWNILGLLAILTLALSFFKGKNAVWGTATLGLVIALIVGVIGWFKKTGFNWSAFKQVMIIAVLLGAVFEIFGMLSKRKEK
jgi:uncharacterized protein YacL